MRRQQPEDVNDAARRRLALVGRELEQAGLVPRRARDADFRAPADVDGDSGGGLGVHGVGRSRPDEQPDEQPDPPAGGWSDVADVAVRPSGRHRARSGSGRMALPRLGGSMVPDTLRGRVGLGPSVVALVSGLAAAAVLLAVWAVVRMDSEPVPPRSAGAPTVAEPLVPDASAPPTASPGASAASSGSVGAAAGSPTDSVARAGSGGKVTVDVGGKVRRPGIAVLPSGARVEDALRAAGGVRGRVDLAGLNRARVLVDGEQVLVGVPPAPGAAASIAGAPGAAPVSGALVNLNTATMPILDQLPGVGPVTAQKILDWRAQHGAFTSVDELMEIDGIGEKTFADLVARVTL